MNSMKSSHQWRPDLTSYETIAREIADRINEEALYALTETDIVKLALERMWKDAHQNASYHKI